MKQHYWCLLLLAGLVGPAAAQVPPGPPAGPPSVIRQVSAPPAEAGTRPAISVRAWVNGKPIFDQDLLNDAFFDLLQADRLPEPQRSAKRMEVLRAHLQNLINHELIVQDAYRKLKDNPLALQKLKDFANKEFEKELPKMKRQAGGEERFLAMLRAQGFTLETFRKKKEEYFIASQYLYSRMEGALNAIGQPEIREYYEQHLNEFQNLDRVEWQDLFIAVGPKHPTLQDAHQFAEQLVQALRQGEDFANLLQYDDGVGSARKGEGIGQRRGEIRPPEIEAYIWNMKDGEVGPPLDLSTGVHVFRLVKRYYAGQMPFDEKVQAQILNKLKMQVRQREQKRILRELTARAVIRIEQRPLP
jgi:parvulin-like peptidyl-prolyl isomerase